MPNDPGQEVAPTQNRGVAAVFQADLDAYTPNLMQALPVHVSVDKFKRVLITAVSSNPDLLYANRRTLFNAAVRCASDGLMPDGREAALVVYRTKMKRRNPQTGLDIEEYVDAVQYLPMVAGIRKRMRNTGDVLSADAHVVYEKDKFKFKLGDDGFIDHEPAGLSEDPGKPVGAYAIIKLKSGEVLRDVLRLTDIDLARNVSRAKNGPLWTTFWGEGARKTALRRCAKAAPQSAELESLLSRDEDEPPMLPAFEAMPALEHHEPEPERMEPAPAPAEDDRPFYTVVDLDGVEHEFREAATAETALMRVLDEAAKQGLERLDGARESNQIEGWVSKRTMEHYETLRRSASPAKRGRPRNPERAAVADPEPKPPEALEGAVDGAGSSSETHARQSAPAAARLADPVSQQSSGQTRLDAEDAGGSPAPKPWPLDPLLQSGEGGADNDDPDRGSLAIEPPIRRGQPDWRTWSIALFLPKVRKAATSNDLAFLVGDNDDNLTKAKAALDREDRATLEEAIARRFQEVEDA